VSTSGARRSRCHAEPRYSRLSSSRITPILPAVRTFDVEGGIDTFVPRPRPVPRRRVTEYSVPRHRPGRWAFVMSGEHKTVIKYPSEYVKLNIGGSLHYTTIGTLQKHDTMLRAMFSGRMEALTDSEGEASRIARRYSSPTGVADSRSISLRVSIDFALTARRIWINSD